MCRKLILLICVVLLPGLAGSARAAVPAGWSNQDIGAVALAGSADESGGTWTLTASGADIWNGADQFHFAFTTLRGDGAISIRVNTITGGTNTWRKAGVMIRETLNAESKFAYMIMRAGTDGGSFGWQPTTTGNGGSTNFGDPDIPRYVRLVRQANRFSAWYSADGIAWTQQGGYIYIDMAAQVYVGLCLTSHNNAELTTATFDALSLVLPNPGTAYNPSPVDRAVKVDINADLSWAAGDGATSHEVYFGTAASAMAKVATNPLGSESYDPGTLAYNTDYYWQIVEVGGAAGPVWTFATVPDPALISDPDLVGYYKLDGNADDSSGYGNHGAVLGNATWVSGLPGLGGAIALNALDGIVDSVKIGGGPRDAYNFTGSFTIAAWVNIAPWDWYVNWVPSIVGKRGEDNRSWTLRRHSSPGLSFTTRLVGNDDTRSVADQPLGKWVHITAVYDMAQNKKFIYFNGVKDQEATTTAGLSGPVSGSQHDTYIGARSNSANTLPEGNFTGLIDEVRLYSRALSAAEVAALAQRYDATGPSPANGSAVDSDSVSLEWSPGPSAALHDVYFSDNFDDVNTATSSDPMGPNEVYKARQSELKYPPGDWDAITVTRGETYYWRIDEVNGVNTWRGQIWSFTVVPNLNWNPNPADQAKFVPVTADLSWSKGALALVGHIIYLSTDFSAVDSVAPGTTTSPEYLGSTTPAGATSIVIPGDLLNGTTYYWRADPIESSSPLTAHKGEVWSFTTDIPIADASLVGWWRLDNDGTGNKVIDYSGYGNHGTITGNPVYVPGPVDEAMEFNGNDYVTCGRDPELILTTGITAACWVRSSNFNGSWKVFMSFRGEGSRGWQLRQSSNHTDVSFTLRNTSAGDDQDTPVNVMDGEWHHVAGTYDGAFRMVYFDGSVVYSIADTGSIGAPSANDKLVIGGRIQDNATGFSENPLFGALDDARLYNRALSAAEIAHLMSMKKAWSPNPANLQMDVPVDVTLRWTAGTDETTGSPYATQRVYYGTDAAAVAAAITTSPEYKGAPTGPNEYGPLSLNYYDRIFWRIDGVESGGGVVAGNVWTFKAIYDPALVVDPNLKAWYKFDGDALDSSGHGRDGTEMNGPTYDAGFDGQAIQLDGVNDWVSVRDPVGISGRASRTISGWARARTTAIADWTDIFGFCPEPAYTTNRYFDVERRGGQSQYCLHVYGFESNLLPVDLEWHFLAATYDGPTQTITGYGDGNVSFTDSTRVLDTVDMVRMGYRPSNNAWFPGLVDDVRIYDYALSQGKLIEVMRINLAWAWKPSPRNGATGVPRNSGLSWTPGDYAPAENGHYVSFGADDPANLVLVSGPQTPNNYTPSPLDLDRAYYWAVDEVNTAAPGGVDKGPIWSFTTANNVVVDDIEGYWPRVTDPNIYIYQVWVDGAGDCNLIAGNNTGALVDIATTPVHGGQQAMKFLYDNDGTVTNPCPEGGQVARLLYSKTEAQVAKLPSGIGSDWTAGGAKALSLWFYGDPLNSIEPMWVQLTDGSDNKAKVLYGTYVDEDVNDMNDASWHEWLIDLADFTDVNLTNVKSIAIGIGTEGGGGGGAGTLYFDDIRLYSPRCVLTRRTAELAVADYAPTGGNCVVNNAELQIMVRDWLQYDYNIEAVAPNPDGLMALYEFEDNANDSSGNGNDAILYNGPTYAAGQIGQAISLDGVDDYVDCGYDATLNIKGAVTISAWINVTTGSRDQKVGGNQDGSTGGYKMGVYSDNKVEFEVRNSLNQSTLNRSVGGGTVLTTGVWYHVAGVYSDQGNYIRTYVNGKLDRELVTTAVLGLSAGPLRLGREPQSIGSFFSGKLDDVRVYNYALSPAEIMSLAGAGAVYVPVTSPANISDLEPVLEKRVNFKDYSLLANKWLEEELFP